MLLELKNYIKELLLVEKRRQDKEGIKRTDVYDVLRGYVGTGSYIHFSNLNKVGINPQSKFNTPLGIYTYPLDEEIFDDLIHDKIPFASERKYIHVIRPNGRVLYLRGQISNDDVLKMINKLRVQYGHKPFETFNDLAWEYDAPSARVRTAGGLLWYFTMIMARRNIVRWNKLWRDLGFVGVVDNGAEGIIHPSEPFQAVFFSRNGIELIETIENPIRKSQYKKLLKAVELYELINNVAHENGYEDVTQMYKNLAIRVIEQHQRDQHKYGYYEYDNCDALLNTLKKSTTYDNDLAYHITLRCPPDIVVRIKNALMNYFNKHVVNYVTLFDEKKIKTAITTVCGEKEKSDFSEFLFRLDIMLYDFVYNRHKLGSKASIDTILKKLRHM